jgi:hypothetical protein
MRAVPYLYLIAFGYCIAYWLVWFSPNQVRIVGSDGGWYFGVGIISMWVLPILIVAWVSKTIRNIVRLRFGNILANLFVATASVFFLWGASLLGRLYIYGI